MAKQCVSCEKNIGLLAARVSLLEDEDVVICTDCFDKMPSLLNDLYQKRINPSEAELLTIKSEIIQQLKSLNFNQATIDIVEKFLNDELSKSKKSSLSSNANLYKKCPICNKNFNYDAEICSGCGYVFNLTTAIEYNQIAQIYNERAKQYGKNPFYEYDLLFQTSQMEQLIRKS